MSATPEELVTLAARGDEAAVRELLERHLPTIQAIVRRRMSRVLRAREESLDIVQSVCRQVLANLELLELRSEDEFGGWLLRAIEHKLVDHYRHLGREKRDSARERHLETTAELGLPEPRTGPSSFAARREQAERLQAAMQALTPLQREALRLHSSDGLPFPAIAERLGITLKQARWNVYKAKYALARRLGGQEPPTG
jgi:RNA polymerase sigma-70 factor (ECF subfamily)